MITNVQYSQSRFYQNHSLHSTYYIRPSVTQNCLNLVISHTVVFISGHSSGISEYILSPLKKEFLPLVTTHKVVLNSDHHSHNSDHLLTAFTKSLLPLVIPRTIVFTSGHLLNSGYYNFFFFLTEKFLLLALSHTIILFTQYCVHLIFSYRIVISSGHLPDSALSGNPSHGSHNLWSSLAKQCLPLVISQRLVIIYAYIWSPLTKDFYQNIIHSTGTLQGK